MGPICFLFHEKNLLLIFIYVILKIYMPYSLLKIMAGQWLLSVLKAFVTAEKPCLTLTMTATT